MQCSTTLIFHVIIVTLKHCNFFLYNPSNTDNQFKYHQSLWSSIFSFHFCNHLFSCTFRANDVLFILNKAFSDHGNLTGCAKEAFVMPSQGFEGNEPGASKSTLTYFNSNKQNKGVSPCSTPKIAITR